MSLPRVRDTALAVVELRSVVMGCHHSQVTPSQCPAGWVLVALSSLTQRHMAGEENSEAWGRELVRSRRVWAPL